MSSWQLAHLSSHIPAGDYYTRGKLDHTRWSVQVVVPVDDGLVSVKHSIDGSCYRILPGGDVEAGETIPQAAIRNMREETGLGIDVNRLMYVRAIYEPEISIEFYVCVTPVAGKLATELDPELPATTQVTQDVHILSFDVLEQDTNLDFYPRFLRNRIRYDLNHPPTTALYVGSTP